MILPLPAFGQRPSTGYGHSPAFLGARTSDSRTCKEIQVGTAPAILEHTSDNTIRLSSKCRQASAEVQVEETMKPNHLALLLAILVFASPIGSLAQQARQDVPPLTLDDAVSFALSNNRLVKNSALEAQKYDFQVSTIRSKRLPHFQVSVLGGQLLQGVDFRFPAGAFGTYSGIGPIPSTESKIHTPAQFAANITGSVDQPLTQQFKLHYGIRATELGRDIAKEDVRAERNKIAAEVRNAYFELVATEAAVNAAQEAVRTLEEAQRVTVHYVSEKTILRVEALEVDARLAKARYDLSVSENGLATQHERLNQLLGRDLETPFRVDLMPEDDTTTLTLQDARQRASQNRPEVRQARLKEKQADYDRRAAKAEHIPDLAAYVGYMGIQNVQVVPTNIGIAGFLFTWEPFDWGRRHNRVLEKTNTLAEAHNGAQETESQVVVEVGSKYRKWKEAVLLLKASRTGHEAAAEQFRVTSNKYKEQAALIRDLLQAQARSSEAAFQYQQALSSYWSSLADLRRAMGEE
jgi:outer membrane protein